MNRQETVALLAGVVGAARTHAGTRNTGNLLCLPGRPGNGSNWEAGATGVGGAHTTDEPG